MKIIELTVRLKFADKISDDAELQEIVDKVMASLVHTVNNSADGLAPDASETFTDSIDITERFSGANSQHKFV